MALPFLFLLFLLFLLLLFLLLLPVLALARRAAFFAFLAARSVSSLSLFALASRGDIPPPIKTPSSPNVFFNPVCSVLITPFPPRPRFPPRSTFPWCALWNSASWSSSVKPDCKKRNVSLVWAISRRNVVSGNTYLACCFSVRPPTARALTRPDLPTGT